MASFGPGRRSRLFAILDVAYYASGCKKAADYDTPLEIKIDVKSREAGA